jgi:hypothetical protein
MATAILGLDIGGANLKAATAEKRAHSVVFPLWKQPGELPHAIAELVAHFPETDTLAVTMTGELCDCFATKRDGVNTILAAVEHAARGKSVRVWSTTGEFISVEAARANHMNVAAANWHALATFAGRFASRHGAMLLDIGSTTTDLIPLNDGWPSTYGTTDAKRLERQELVYIGVRRTPVCAVVQDRVCAEFFATLEDVYTLLGLLPEASNNLDTADGRPMSVEFCFARLARMLGGDRETHTDDQIIHFAARVHSTIRQRIAEAARAAYYGSQSAPELHAVIVSGAGEFLARQVAGVAFPAIGERQIVSLTAELGPEVSACAPAYAVAVLAKESE